MFKKITALVLCAIMSIGCYSVSAAFNDAVVVVNEVFEDYALNSKPNGITLSGLNARVVASDGDGKALYAGANGTVARMVFPINQTFDKMVFSFDLKLNGGTVIGNILTLASSSSLLKFNENGKITLEDGYSISGLRDNVWKNYTAAVDFSKNTYTLYVDGKAVVKNWNFYKQPVKPSEFDFVFIQADDNEEVEVMIDNVRVYSGNTILNNSYFPKKAQNNDIEDFTPASSASSSEQVYIDSYSKEGLYNITFTAKTEAAGWQSLTDGGEEYIHFAQYGTADCYADVGCDVVDAISLIYQMDIYPINMVAGTAILIRAIKEGNGSSDLLSTNANGYLKCGATTTTYMLPTEKWTTLTVVCNHIFGTMTVYADDMLIAENVAMPNGGRVPTKFRTGWMTRNTGRTGTTEFYLNRIKLYDGDEIREFDDSSRGGVKDNNGEYVSGHDSREEVINMLDSDTVYMTHGDFYYHSRKKHRYSESTSPASYTNENSVIMVPEALIEEGLGIDVSFDSSSGRILVGGKNFTIGSTGGILESAPVVKDGVLFLPVASLAKKVLGKYVYNDVRGFVLISDKNRDYRNSDVNDDNLEKIDIIYRYLQFDRPVADEIYDAVVKTSYKQHPRLFATNEQIKALRKKIDESAELKKYLVKLIQKCEGYITTPLVEYYIPDGLRLFQSCHSVRNINRDLAVAYLITGSDKYRDRLWLETENALNWKDWNVSNHFLDSGEIGPGIAFAYDVLYDYLTDEQKQWFRDRVEELFIDYCIDIYEGRAKYTAKDGRFTSSNWGAVCSTSVLLTALTFIDEEPEDSIFTKKCKFIAENAVQGLEYPIGNLFPDGTVDEGMVYWGYYVQNLTWSINSLINVCGNDYGLLAAPGYQNVMEYAIYMQTRNGNYNFGTAGNDSVQLPATLFRISDLSESDEMMQVVYSYNKLLGTGLGAEGLLWYKPTDVKVDLNKFNLDKSFPSLGVTIMRSSWIDPEGSYLGIVADRSSQTDAGSYIFESQGHRFFVELGGENKNIEGYYTTANKLLYRHRAEGQNGVLIINPTAADPGQTNGVPVIENLESKAKGAKVVYDLTDMYQGQVSSYKKAYYLGENRQSLIVNDELELLEANNDIYMFWQTEDKITISDDGKSAIVEAADGKKIKFELVSNASSWHLEVRDASAMFEENVREGEYSRDTITKIAFVGKAPRGKLNISIKVTPYEDGSTYEPLTEFISYNKWIIPDGELETKPTLSSITVNGEPIHAFSEATRDYTVQVYEGDPLPTVEAISNDGTVNITQPKDFSEQAVIRVQKSNGMSATYTVRLELTKRVIDAQLGVMPYIGKPDNVEFAPIKSMYASHEPQAANPAVNAGDGDFKTRWAADTKGAFLEADLGDVKKLDGIAMAFASGAARIYSYEIQISEDGINYYRIYQGGSFGGTAEWEYLPASVSARYVRYVGYANNKNKWNNITEFRPCISK